jgi:hypothetical protein
MLSSARVLTNLVEQRTIPVTEMKSFDELSSWRADERICAWTTTGPMCC